MSNEMKRYDPLSEVFLFSGRRNPRAKKAELWWSGSGVVMRLRCRTLRVEAESTAKTHAQYLGVMIDGAPVARLPMDEGVNAYTVLAGMDPQVWHEVTVLRDTQPSYDEDGPVILHGILTDGEIEKPADKPLLIEFIGDSLTVGEGTLGPQSGQEWIMPYISHMPAFPTLTAEALGAEKRIVALGGWGAYKSWDGHHESRIGAIYEKLCAVTPGGDIPYDFSGRAADFVIINLGTNDGTALKDASPETLPGERENFRRDAEELMRLVRAHQPKARIFWAYGLCGSVMAPCIQKAIEARRAAGDQRVSYLPLPEAEEVGSRFHPSRRAHRRAARVIEEAIRAAGKEE